MLPRPLSIFIGSNHRGMITLAKDLAGINVLKYGEAILSAAKTDRVLVCSGFPVIGHPETDGPTGALMLANALYKLRCPVAFVTYRDVLDIVSLLPETHFELIDIASCPHNSKISGVPVTIEICGRGVDGNYYNMLNEDISADAPKFETAIGCHSLVSVGDGGNEFGFGSAPDSWFDKNNVHKPVSTCQYLLPAEVSNWGALALVAALQVLSNVELLPKPEEYQLVLQKLAAQGMVDGVLRTSQPTEDGYPEGAGKKIISELQAWTQCESQLVD